MALNIALKAAIKNSGYYQFIIADAAGLTEQEFSKVVNGRREATPDEKKAIAKALKRKVDELFTEVAA